jgi:hypothetical protein
MDRAFHSGELFFSSQTEDKDPARTESCAAPLAILKGHLQAMACRSFLGIGHQTHIAGDCRPFVTVLSSNCNNPHDFVDMWINPVEN